MSILGILGATPSRPPGPVRADRLARLTQQVGALEQAPAADHPALHAAAHALMNGVPRVIVSPVDDVGAEAAWIAALERLLEMEQVPLVVAPGLLDVPIARALAAAVLQSPPTALWLDSPDGEPASTVQHRGRLPGSRDRVRVARPWVSGLTPGRPGRERLPPSCLVAPLHLRTTRTLAGTFEPPPAPDPGDLADLKRTGCGVLVATGIQKRIGLAWDLPRPGPPPRLTAVTTLSDRIEEALREATDPILAGQQRGVTLRRSLERASTVVLSEFKRRGEVVDFTVRCLPGEGTPVVEVGFRTPRYVQQVIVRSRVRPASPREETG